MRKQITVLIGLIIILCGLTGLVSSQNKEIYTIKIYHVKTPDDSSITLTRYKGGNKSYNPIIFIHGMGGNHLMYDFDENHSLARFLAKKGWDVWLLDLRTHDGDGDYFFGKNSDREYINRYWDFDNTLLKIDVVTAVNFVKNKTGFDKLFLSGHSYGGYLAYAYAILIGEQNLSGIITTAADPYAMPEDVYKIFTSNHPLIYLSRFGFFVGNKAFVNPIGLPCDFPTPKFIVNILMRNYKPSKLVFYDYTTPLYVQKGLFHHSDSEAAGVWVDMFFGKHPTKYAGSWVDPQTLFNYSAHLEDINVPILFIAGDEDPQDPADNIYKGYENVSSTDKTFYNFSEHSHLDLLLGEDADELIFTKINSWLQDRITTDYH